MVNSFFQRYDELKAGYTSQEHELQTELHENEEVLRQNELTIRRLRKEQLEKSQKLYQTRQILSGLHQEMREDIVELVFSEFNSFQQYMAVFLENKFGLREELSQKLEGILSQDPTLEQELFGYNTFIEKIDDILVNTVPYYRSSIEHVIHQQETRLKPCLDLEHKLKSLPEEGEKILPLVTSFDEADSQLYMALPAAIQNEAQNQQFIQRMDSLENALMQCIFFLAQDPDWVIVEIDRIQWANFRGLTALAEYNGNGSKVEAIQDILKQKIPEFWSFKNSMIPQPEVAELDWQTWQLGSKLYGAILDLKAISSEEAEFGGISTSEEMLVLDFFQEKDIVSWNRSLRVVESSNWNVAGRRMRTLLMRMAVQGRIGKDEVKIQTVLLGLPEAHKNSFQKMLPQLVEKGLLLSSNHESPKAICLNPDYLSEVQSLINRDVTPFWEPILREEV